jgi:hypothetical protein
VVVVVVVVVVDIVEEDPLGEEADEGDEGELDGGNGSGHVSSKTFRRAACVVYSL